MKDNDKSLDIYSNKNECAFIPRSGDCDSKPSKVQAMAKHLIKVVKIDLPMSRTITK